MSVLCLRILQHGNETLGIGLAALASACPKPYRGHILGCRHSPVNRGASGRCRWLRPGVQWPLSLSTLRRRKAFHEKRCSEAGRGASAAPVVVLCPRVHTGRLLEAVHRRHQQLQPHHPRSHASQRRFGSCSERRQECGGCAVRDKHHRRVRRHRYEPPGHEVQPAEPRTDRGFSGDCGAGASVRRSGLRMQLRQDRPRHADGGGPRQRAGHHRCWWAHAGRPRRYE